MIMTKEKKTALFNFYVASLIISKPEMNDKSINVLVKIHPEMDASMTIDTKEGNTIILDCDLSRDVFGQPKALFSEVCFSDIGM
jgi:hypothetical protein